MSQDKDPLNVEQALEQLDTALPLQIRSVAAFTMAAASITGFQYVGLTDLLWRFARAELEDVRRLAEKMVTLGGRPPSSAPDFELPNEPDAAVEQLIAWEKDATDALQDVIPSTGHTGDSEALEHRLEHIIMRKQEQIDSLERARRA